MCTSYSQQLALRSFQPLSLGLSVHLPWCLLKQIKLSCWQPIVLTQYRGGELQSWLLPLYSTEIQWLNDRSELKEEDLNEKNWNRRYRWSRIIAWHSTDYHRMPVTEVACYIPPAHRAGTHHWYTPLVHTAGSSHSQILWFRLHFTAFHYCCSPLLLRLFICVPFYWLFIRVFNRESLLVVPASVHLVTFTRNSLAN